MPVHNSAQEVTEVRLTLCASSDLGVVHDVDQEPWLSKANDLSVIGRVRWMLFVSPRTALLSLRQSKETIPHTFGTAGQKSADHGTEMTSCEKHRYNLDRLLDG